MSLMSSFKGIVGEIVINVAMWLKLDKDIYHRLNNITLPLADGGSTQIDHVIVSRYGIFVIETKNYKGWIFGNEKQRQWTQVIMGRKYKFQNPLRQNYKHVKTLESLLEVSAEAIHSVIVFTGDSTFKTAMPANVRRGAGYIAYIKSFRTPVLSVAEVEQIVVQIQSGRLAQTRATNRRHVEHLQTRNDPNAEKKCRACGSAMLLRTAKRGHNAGNQFWGCSAYPACRSMQNIK